MRLSSFTSILTLASARLASASISTATATATKTAVVVVVGTRVIEYPPTAVPKETVYTAKWEMISESEWPTAPACSKTGVCYGKEVECSGTKTLLQRYGDSMSCHKP